MTRSLNCLSLFASLTLGLGAAGNSLAPASPFAPPDGGTAVSSENQPLELRGILTDVGGYRFSVYDPAKHTGQWVRLNESGHDFTVKSHDAARDTITLEYQGRMLTLPLRNSKVVGMTVVAPEPANIPSSGPRPPGAVPGSGPQPKASSPEETARFNRAVEEINRRRALRGGAGASPGPMPMPGQGNAGPGPVPVKEQGSNPSPAPRP